MRIRPLVQANVLGERYSSVAAVAARLLVVAATWDDSHYLATWLDGLRQLYAAQPSRPRDPWLPGGARRRADEWRRSLAGPARQRRLHDGQICLGETA